MASDFSLSSALDISGTIDNAGVLTATPDTYDPNVFPSAASNTAGLNSASGADESILSQIWDTGKSAFTAALPAIADVYRTNALANLQTAQANAALQNRLATTPPYTPQQRYTISIASIGAIVLLGAAFILMQRKR